MKDAKKTRRCDAAAAIHDSECVAVDEEAFD